MEKKENAGKRRSEGSRRKEKGKTNSNRN